MIHESELNFMTPDEARAFFTGDRYATEVTGIFIEDCGTHYAKCSLAVRPDHRNAVGQVMGGVLFTLADFTFAVAANNGGVPTVTAVSQITFLSPVRGEKLFAETTFIKDGKRSCHYLIEITDDQDTLVATVSSTGMHLNN